ncbi:MAG: hypothetical protein M3Q99_08040 [Acidobacteriota bacterium]|nr:hypothetical protein [Acidobacteriota bacterium]
MKIFVAYGYNERDKWIKEMVFPIIEAFGAEVETGEMTYDDTIPQSVENKIRRSDALIAFTTRRTTQDNIIWQTHRWVIEELAAARTLQKKFVEVRETGVDPQGGWTQNNQRIEYDENARDKCLIEIVKAVGVWQSNNLVRVQLLPQVIRGDLQPLLNDEGLSCKYVIRTGNYVEDAVSAKIVKITGGLFIYVPQLKSDSLIQISIRHGSREWSSDYESLNSYGIHLS